MAVDVTKIGELTQVVSLNCSLLTNDYQEPTNMQIVLRECMCT